jgi:hypothetical protein
MAFRSYATSYIKHLEWKNLVVAAAGIEAGFENSMHPSSN